MISDGSFVEFECALSIDKHFIKEPITLSCCGHSVCRNCLPKTDSIIKCNLCGLITNRDLNNDKESISIKIALKRNLNSLLSILEKQANIQLENFKNYVNNDGIDTIDLKIKSIKDEIDVRIESIKNELDKINDKFKHELELIREELVRVENSEIERYTEEVKKSENSLKELKGLIENKVFDNEDKFYEHQDNMKRINDIMKDCENYQLEFKETDTFLSDKFLKKSLIGELLFKSFKKLDEKSIRNRFKHIHYEVFGLTTKPYFLCVLPDGLIASVNRYEKNITIYDWKFYLVNTITRIDNSPFSPYEMATSEFSIYILDRSAHQIIMTDLSFNKIKSFGSLGNDSQKFNVPYSICYQNNFIYVTDCLNKRIQILTSNLVYYKSKLLNYKPRYICTSDKIVCVKSYDETDTYFYDIDTFSLKYKYVHGFGRISVINSYFFEICVANRKLHFYNCDGSQADEISLNKFASYVSNSWNGHFVCYNGNLIMSCSSQKLVLKF